MSLELKDFRGKITTETDCVLEAMSRTSGRDRSEIVREILHKYALDKIDEHSLLADLLAREGVAGASKGR